MTPHPANPVHPVRTPWPTVRLRLGEVLDRSEETIAQTLKPVVYHHSGQHLGYGLKFWPKETMAWFETEPTLQWVKQTYQ